MKRHSFSTSAWANLGRRTILPVLTVVAFQNTAFAVTFTKLVNFNGTNGKYPSAEFVIDSAGNLYGTTTGGGSYNYYGTVFKLTPPAAGQSAWTRTTLVNFNSTNGASPYAGLVLDSAGNFYGTTFQGGPYTQGTVFKLTPPVAGQTAWTRTTLVNFNGTNGANPLTDLVLDSAGSLYGTTSQGGSSISSSNPSGYGTVFKLTPPATGQTAWTRTTLVNFSSTNGAHPQAGLVRDSVGNLYGTTLLGGSSISSSNPSGYGTVFKLTPPTTGQTAWTRTTLVNFSSTNGAYPADLVRDSAGNLYGTTWGGGSYDYGTVFKLAPPATGQTTWTRTTLVNFNKTNGANPSGRLVLDAAGNLYGITHYGGSYGYGNVFKLASPPVGQTAWTRTTLINFNGTNGAEPSAGLVRDSAGNLYGTTWGGGSYNFGTVLKITP